MLWMSGQSVSFGGEVVVGEWAVVGGSAGDGRREVGDAVDAPVRTGELMRRVVRTFGRILHWGEKQNDGGGKWKGKGWMNIYYQVVSTFHERSTISDLDWNSIRDQYLEYYRSHRQSTLRHANAVPRYALTPGICFLQSVIKQINRVRLDSYRCFPMVFMLFRHQGQSHVPR